MDKTICTICKRPKNSVGSSVCSYPHPVSRHLFEEAMIDARINELEKLSCDCGEHIGMTADIRARLSELRHQKDRMHRKTYGMGECDFCGETNELVQGPYDNLICRLCCDQFIEEENL